MLKVELIKLAFPALGALWLFYGVTILGLLKQLQDPGGLLNWPNPARVGVFVALAGFLIINALAIAAVQVSLVDLTNLPSIDLTLFHKVGIALLGLHILVDVGVLTAAWHALKLSGVGLPRLPGRANLTR